MVARGSLCLLLRVFHQRMTLSAAVVDWKHTTIGTKVPNVISLQCQQGTFTSTQCTKVQGSEDFRIKTDKVPVSSNLRALIKERFRYNI